MVFDKEPWKIVILEHDAASRQIGKFFDKIWSDEITRKGIKEKRMYYKKKIVKRIEEVVGCLEGKVLTLYGYGGYHHYTYGLCNAIAHKRSKNYTYFHIDNHSDANLKFDNDTLGCDSFVTNILEEPGAKDILFLGNEGYENYTSIKQKVLISGNVKKILQRVLKEKPQQDVYLSFDLDILNKKDIMTPFPQGILELKHLLNILDIIQEEKNIISADILGHGGYTNGYPKSLLVYAALAAKLTGKDTKNLEEAHNYFRRKYSNIECPSYCYQVKKDFRKITEQLRI